MFLSFHFYKFPFFMCFVTECVLGSEHCQNAADLHCGLYLNASCVDSCEHRYGIEAAPFLLMCAALTFVLNASSNYIESFSYLILLFIVSYKLLPAASINHWKKEIITSENIRNVHLSTLEERITVCVWLTTAARLSQCWCYSLGKDTQLWNKLVL